MVAACRPCRAFVRPLLLLSAALPLKASLDVHLILRMNSHLLYQDALTYIPEFLQHSHPCCTSTLAGLRVWDRILVALLGPSCGSHCPLHTPVPKGRELSRGFPMAVKYPERENRWLLSLATTGHGTRASHRRPGSTVLLMLGEWRRLGCPCTTSTREPLPHILITGRL